MADDLSGGWTVPGGGEGRGARLLSPGDRVGGRYVVRSFLGAGGMGEVYEAEHTDLGRRVALKVMKPAVAARPGFAERFRREGRVLARLDHPGIVTVHDMGEDARRLFIAMEFVAGPSGAPRSLADELAERGRLSEPEVKRLALRVADALAAAHSQGVLHRDLKPGNVLLGADGRAKLADFGLARIAGADLMQSIAMGAEISEGGTDILPVTLPGAVLGTPEYMSPEQSSGGELDERSDVYSLGAMVYRMLTGERPAGLFEMPSELGLAAGWDAVVRGALAQRPEGRFATAAEFGAAVRGVDAGGGAARPEAERGLSSDAGAPRETRQPAEPAVEMPEIGSPPPRDPGRGDRRRAATKALARSYHVSSAKVIAFLADVTGRPQGDAVAAVDGFWEYVSDSRNYRSTRGAGWSGYLAVPHFGTFRLKAAKDGRRKIDFRSHPRAEFGGAPKRERRGFFSIFSRAREPEPEPAPKPEHSHEWVAKLAGGSGRELSVKRRIAVHIAREKGIGLYAAHELLWEMLDLLAGVFREARAQVSWARRGTMFPCPSRRGRDPSTGAVRKYPAGRYYKFRTLRSYSKRLAG
ncbi:MAG: serine/threonine-protein kinase [Planctomycetota bacterium]|jgi:serine/threonine protein kinase